MPSASKRFRKYANHTEKSAQRPDLFTTVAASVISQLCMLKLRKNLHNNQTYLLTLTSFYSRWFRVQHMENSAQQTELFASEVFATQIF